MTRIDGRWLVTLNTIGGTVLALGLAASGYIMLGGGWSALAFAAPATIVIAGAVAGVLASCRGEDIVAAVRAIGQAFAPSSSSEEVIEPLVRAARIARRQGLISIEQNPPVNAPAFLTEALSLAADGVAPETIRQVLDVQQKALRRRDQVPIGVVATAARCACAAGALASLLIALAATQSTTALTPGLLAAPAVAALLYGLSIAALLGPVAIRLQRAADEAASTRELVADGVLSIREGITPRLVDQALRGRAGMPRVDTLMEAPRRAA